MKKAVIENIQNFVKNYQKDSNITTRWGVPVVKFASSSDPLFSQLSSVASPTHAVPQDFLPEAKSVIAYFLPFKKSISRSNINGQYSSDEWGYAYTETNEIIRQLNLYLQKWLDSQAHQSIVIPATHNWDEKKLISDWSHRHIAYIAGLGTFGLNNMLITNQGSCGRIGSFITSAEIEPDIRSNEEACLYKYDGSCQKCAHKCVNGALTAQSFDRFKCYEMLLKNVKKHRSIGYVDACGKCLVGLPCSYINPVKSKFHVKKLVVET